MLVLKGSDTNFGKVHAYKPAFRGKCQKAYIHMIKG
jgi:hypothetical protein